MADTGELCERSRIFILNAATIRALSTVLKIDIKYFDPGVQGEHKIRRGFQPKIDSSFHYFLKDDFGDAVSNFCKSEKKQIENYIEACKSYTPFNKDYKI